MDLPGAPALEATGLTKRYRRGVLALDDVSLAIGKGSITALVGPNGAGKSTLIRTWIGFERPTEGTVRVGGIDPQVDRPGAISQLGYVGQATVLYRGLTVADHIDLAASLRPRFDERIATERLEQQAISSSQRAGTLSGGQAAQVALALALGTGAPVLLLDEPLASLDPLARHDFLNVVATAVKEQSVTALLSSHIVSDVETVCEDLIVLGKGHVTLHAPIRETLGGHRIVGDGARPDAPIVATFSRPGGERASLVRSPDPALPRPTLEELVMGYLAAGRPPSTPPRRRAD